MSIPFSPEPVRSNEKNETDTPDSQDGVSKDSDTIRRKAEETLNELIELYEKTDPALGKESERFKYSRALTTLRLCSRLTEDFSRWAESQIFGEIHFRNMGLRKHTADSHLNERGNYKYYRYRKFVHYKPLRLNAEQFREYIAIVLDYSSTHPGGWRKSLSKELIALNEGEAQFITTPSDKGGQGRPYTLRFLRFISVSYVYYFVGKGMTKHKALEYVGSTIGASPETLRDRDKNILPQFGERKQIQAIARLIGKHASKSVEDPFGEIDLDHDDAPPGLHDRGCSGRMMDFSRISAKLTPLLGQVVGERSLGRLPG